jgi:predicted GNAT superfamily acetyltransferase
MTLILRDLAGMDEFRQAEALQRAVWGEGDKEDPADLMMVIQAEGGLVAGAFEDGALLGYVFGFPTVTAGVQHSHRLAVLEVARGRGLGPRLKWYQRDWCLARGIRLVRWTYDPLRRVNAMMNITRLGGQVSTYLPDYYGAMEGINKGTASDRLLVDWHLNSDGVQACAEGQVGLTPAQMASALHVEIPVDFEDMLRRDPEGAAAERLRVRLALQEAFAQGLVIRGFDAGRGAYLLLT